MLEIKSLGSRFQRLKPTEIQITEGKLANQVFQAICQIEPTKTTLTLKLADRTIGTAHAEYDSVKRRTTFFDAFIQKEYQMHGLASLMVHLLFREQLLYTETEIFDIRNVMKSTSEKEVIENVGMGLIALKLGFEPDINHQELFAGKNVSAIDIIQANGIYPWGYKFTLRSSPWTIVLVLLDPISNRPVKDLIAYEHFIRPEDFAELVKTNQAVLGNVDYILNKTNLEQFVPYIAENQGELQQFLKKLKR
jgi:hypothetical protein